jgi:hypothetical protein
MSETTFPGWYVEFQAAVLRQLPRPDKLGKEIGEGWINNQGALKKVLATILFPQPSQESSRFTLFKDLGIITVPDNYVHETRLASFKKENCERFLFYDKDIIDENFAKVTTKLVPGQKLHVKVFKQIVSGTTTSEERLAFLKTQNAVLVGAQGASLVFEQKREDLPEHYGYISLDEKKAFWEITKGIHRVPGLYQHWSEDWEFRLGGFGHDWDNHNCLLCFCDCD